MKSISNLILIGAMAIVLGQFAQAKENQQAAKFALEARQAVAEKDWNKAIEMYRKAADLDRKFMTNLGIAYQQRGFVAMNEQRFQDAMLDFSEAIELTPQDARVYEQRAAVEMKINEHDKALADYSQAIKLNPSEVRDYLYRAYIYELKGDIKNSMADTAKVLKVDPKNEQALSRKQRLQKLQQSQPPSSPAPH
jgi:tetratricopeptide (TPR) repeat protein